MMSFNLLLSAFFSLFPLVGSLVLILRDKSWPVILLLLGSTLSFCTTLLHVVIGGGGSSSYVMLGYAGLPGHLLFSVGFLAYALKRERAG